MPLDIIRGDKSVGFSSRRTQSATLPYPDESPSQQELIADLAARLANVETLVEGKADASKVRTLIAYSDEAVLIKAQDIVLAGDVTIAKVIAEQNGTTSGEVPIEITQIIGSMIRTGSLVSTNWGASAGSYISLDNGVIAMGGSDSPKFLYEDGNITIAGTLAAGSVITDSVTVDGVEIGAIKAAAENALPADDFGASLQDSLTAGVADIVAGAGGDYTLEVSSTSIIAKHKDADEAGIGSSYSGDIRTGLIVTSTGIAMGYNKKDDGSWVNAVSIGSTGDVSILGTLAAGSIITDSVTVDGVTLGTIKGNASTGASHAGATGNPHGASLAQISGDLDDIADGSLYYKTTPSQAVGGTRAINALDGNYDYIRGISTQRIVVSESNPSYGIVTDSAGIRAYAASSPTFTLNASTGAAFFGGDVLTNGYLFAAGAYSAATGYTAAIQASPANSSQRAVVGHSSGIGVGTTGITATGIGVQGAATSSGGKAMQAVAYSSSDIAMDIVGLLTIDNTTLVSNLNADLLDGNHASAFATAGHSHTLSGLTPNTTWVKGQTSLDGSTVSQNLYFRVYNW